MLGSVITEVSGSDSLRVVCLRVGQSDALLGRWLASSCWMQMAPPRGMQPQASAWLLAGAVAVSET